MQVMPERDPMAATEPASEAKVRDNSLSLPAPTSAIPSIETRGVDYKDETLRERDVALARAHTNPGFAYRASAHTETEIGWYQHR